LLFFAAFFASACGSALALTSGSLHAQGGVDLDTIQAGQFDNGKMWTFEYAPSDYFTQTYGFTADQAWFDRARLSVLRIPGCSASFVSPNGLVATNHHCVRGSVSRVSGQGEGLLDNGFFARTLEDERRIPDYYADQLLAVVDVSDDVFAAADRATTLQAVQARLKQEHAAVGDSVWVQIVALYHGGRYSAYVFRRFTDVRLVAAVELQLGFFGGDPDNFTYPRYALDFAFLRVYDAEGNPYRPTHYFTMAGGGVQEGDAVFVIGNPGQTNRLRTVAQLEYQRDVSVPATQRYLETRHGVLADFLEAYPEEGEALGIRNQIFGLSNSLKAYTGRLDALNDPVILARRSDSEHQLREAIAADPELSERYAGLFDRMAQIQRDKEEYAAVFSASLGQTGQYSSATLRRALVADWYLEAQAAGAPADTLSMIRQEFQRIGDHPAAIEHGLLAARFEDFERYFGPEHLITQTALQGLSPIEAATAMLDGTPLSRGQTAAEALSGDRLSPAEDPALRLVAAILPTAAEYRQAFNRLQAEEVELESDLGRVRFAGRDVLSQDHRWSGKGIRVQRYPGTAVHHFLRALRPILRAQRGCGLGASRRMAHPAGRPGPEHATELRVYIRHLRRELGLARRDSRTGAGRAQLRPQHRRSVARLHLPPRARPERDGGRPRDSGDAGSRLRSGPDRGGARFGPAVPERGGGGRGRWAVTCQPIGSSGRAGRRVKPVCHRVA
jgi:hypothetical protein